VCNEYKLWGNRVMRKFCQRIFTNVFNQIAHKSNLRVFLPALCLATLPAIVQGQNSSILGTLTDPTGAVVPKGTVTVTEKATGATQTGDANELGLFRILNLLPGTYSLKADVTGFKKLEISDIVLPSGQIRDLGKVTLALGTVTEEVSVTAQATPVQTASSERSELIDSNQLKDVALKGRDVFGYMRLIPGVVDTQSDRSLAGSTATANININGMRSGSKNVTFDGVTELDQGGADNVFVSPSLDAVGEVKVLTNAYQAEYGRTSGGTINFVTKAGSQDFHGSAFWNRRHESMNANTFFNNRSGIQRPVYRYFVGGGTIGGPVYIPGRFNKDRRKLFFFWSEEVYQVAQPTQTSTANMPTVSERAGDFSNSRNAAGQVITIKDPQNGGAPFVGNVIPGNRIDPTGQAYLNLFAKPNGYVNPAPGQQFTANFLASYTPSLDRRDDIVRIDYNITKSMLIYGRYGNDVGNRSIPFVITPAGGTLNELRPGRVWAGHIVNTFSPTLVNEAVIGAGTNSFGYDRIDNKDSDFFRSSSFNPPTLRPFPTGEGYQPYLAQASFAGGAVSNPARFSPAVFFPFPPFPVPYKNFNDTYSFQDDVTKILGNHSLKVGIYFENNTKSEPGFGATYPGSFNFGSDPNNPNDTGHGYANALLGVFQSYSEASNRLLPTIKFHEWEGYVQDNWRINRRLTLDVGVRFYQVGLWQETEAVKTYSNFYPQLWVASKAARIYRPALVGGKAVAQDPVTGATTFFALANTLIPGTGDPVNGMRVNGLTGHSDFADLPGIVFGPRIGLAWDATGDGKTAIRASLGLFPQRPDGNWLPGRAAPPTIFTPTVFYTTIDQITNAAAAAAISPSGAAQIFGPQNVARATQVNFTVQRDIGFGTVVDIAYVGNFDRKAVVTRQINPIPLGAYGNPNNLFNGGEINANLLRNAYPGMGAISYQCNCVSDLNYHGLQVNAQHRMSRGLQFGVSYVFSKALGTQGSDPYHTDRSWYYGPLGQDRTHVFNFNWVYQIPGVSNHIAKYVVNNWTLSGIASAQTGAPVSPACSAVSGPVTATDPSLTGGGARCQVVGDPNNFTQSFFTNFNTAAYALAPAGTFGNAGLNSLRQPGWWNTDLTLDKRIPLGKEKVALRARIEAYNVFNHTQFSTIDTTLRLSGTTNINTTYGQYTATNPARVLSTSLRLEF
jgi:hypothetical protein